MLRFESLESDVDELRRRFSNAQPFEHIVIDDFCEEEALLRLYDDIPDPITHQINKSRDCMFARNKHEKSGFRDMAPEGTGQGSLRLTPQIHRPAPRT
jgi:hypothetical protein